MMDLAEYEQDRKDRRRRYELRRLKSLGNCTWRGEHTGLVKCPSCGGGGVSIKVFSCDKHGRCTVARSADGIACCKICTDYEVGT